MSGAVSLASSKPTQPTKLHVVIHVVNTCHDDGKMVVKCLYWEKVRGIKIYVAFYKCFGSLSVVPS